MKVLAQDGVLSRNFGDGVGVDDVDSRGKSLPEGDLNTGGASFEVEVLVAECCRAADVVDRDDDDGEIEVVFGAIGNLNGAIDSVAVDQWRTKPVEQERGGDQRAERFVDAVRGTAGIFDRDGRSKSARLGGAAGKKSFHSENNPYRKIAGGNAPVVGRNASGGMQRDVDLDTGVERGQTVFHNDERGHGLGGNERAKAERRDSQEPKRLCQDIPHVILLPLGLILRWTQRKRTAR